MIMVELKQGTIASIPALWLTFLLIVDKAIIIPHDTTAASHPPAHSSPPHKGTCPPAACANVRGAQCPRRGVPITACYQLEDRELFQ